MKVKSLSHVRLCDPMDGSLPGSKIHGIFQARILEWAAVSFFKGLLRWLSGKESASSSGAAGETGSIPGWGKSRRGGNGNPLQYSCLENPMDRGVWQGTVHRVTKNRTQLKQLSTHSHTRACDLGLKPETDFVFYLCSLSSLHSNRTFWRKP